MRIGGYSQNWHVLDENSLEQVLAWRDGRGGGVFWLAPDEEQYPQLGVRISGDLADIIYLPQDGHPGFRCVGGQGVPEGGLTTLVYEGCDPASGEQEPNEFIVSTETAINVAREFFRFQTMFREVTWFEL